MRKSIVPVLSAAALVGCTQGDALGNAGDLSEAAAAAELSRPAEDAKRSDVYIAFAPQRDSASMLAMSGGRLEVVDNCLVLRSELATYVPVFVPSADTYVTQSSVVIAGRAVPLGTEIQTAGGELGVTADSLLQQPRPSRCRHRLLRVGSWAVVKR